MRPSGAGERVRLAFVVSHPVQYYVPLYRRLAQREDISIKVFYTWHQGATAVNDSGFERAIQWDVPLVDGYDHELVPNEARRQGTHRFLGLRNPSLVDRLLDWNPDVVHVTGYAWLAHLLCLRTLHRRRIPVLFRGDSHLLDEPRRGARWWMKRAALYTVYSWPAVCLYVGQANKAYYKAFGVPAGRLRYCPHSIDTGRFCEPAERLESEARAWRDELGLNKGQLVLLYAGKFEHKKRPLELMRAVREFAPAHVTLVMVGAGELETEVRALAARNPERFYVLPFQNQSRMPLVYRIGDLCILPSGHGETWGLAVNEALACGRPVIVSDKVGCAADLVERDCGWVFPSEDWRELGRILHEAAQGAERLFSMRVAARSKAHTFEVRTTEQCLVDAIRQLTGRRCSNTSALPDGKVVSG